MPAHPAHATHSLLLLLLLLLLSPCLVGKRCQCVCVLVRPSVSDHMR